MRKEKINEISLSLKDLASTAVELVEVFNGSSVDGAPNYNISWEIHGADVTYADCVSRIVTMSEIADKFSGSKSLLMVPINRVEVLEQRIRETQKSLNMVAGQFQQVVKEGGGVQVFNHDNFHLLTTRGTNHDFRAVFKRFSDCTEVLLDAFYQVLNVLRPTRSTYSFQAAASALSSLIEDFSARIHNLHETNANLMRAVAEASDQVSAVSSQAKRAKDAAGEMKRVQEEISNSRKTVSEYLAEVTSKKASIEATYSDASALEKVLEEYREKFESFDRQLKDRTKDFEIGKQQQETLVAQFDEQRVSVDRLILDSESMLKGATVAGLASSFSGAHEELGKQLMWARCSFYVGIAFLFISAIPLMLYVFLPIMAPFLEVYFPELADAAPVLDTQAEISGWQYLGQVLARFIILLPAAWLVSFAGIRHSSLFRLREHYAYKYSMAVSVEGFRKQATGYENEITALVLEQLAFNPADKLTPSKDIPEGKAPHPLLDILVDKFRSGVSKGK